METFPTSRKTRTAPSLLTTSLTSPATFKMVDKIKQNKINLTKIRKAISIFIIWIWWTRTTSRAKTTYQRRARLALRVHMLVKLNLTRRVWIDRLTPGIRVLHPMTSSLVKLDSSIHIRHRVAIVHLRAENVTEAFLRKWRKITTNNFKIAKVQNENLHHPKK